MKKLTLSITLLLATTIFAQVPAYVPTNGLVGWWPFNGNANDESGNGNNGTVNGATLTSDRNGVANNAYVFAPASNSNINIPFSNSLNTIQTGITLSAWIYMDGGTPAGTPPRILELRGAYGGGGDAGFVMLSTDNNNTFRSFELRWYSNNGNSNLNYSPTNNQLTALNWHMISFTADGVLGVTKYYYDGVLQSTSNQDIITQCNYNNNPLILGSEPNMAGQWGGKLDDIGIWNRALTDIEITTLFEGCNISIASQPQDQNVPTSIGTANFSVSSSSSNALYQWQTNLGLGFQNLSNAGQYSGATSSTLSVSNLSMTNNNQVFRCLINDAGCTDTTTIATLTIIDDASVLETDFPLISISPNPTAGDFTIAGLELYNNISTIRVSDVNGKLVKALDPTAIKFTLGSVKPGIYFLTITAGDKQEVIKIIKE